MTPNSTKHKRAWSPLLDHHFTLDDKKLYSLAVNINHPNQAHLRSDGRAQVMVTSRLTYSTNADNSHKPGQQDAQCGVFKLGCRTYRTFE